MARTLGLRGVDLSHYQATTVDGQIKRASDGVLVGRLTDYSFAIVKATHGSAQNSGWSGHSANVRKAGLVLGAYHWLTDTDPIAEQATKFLAVARTADFLVVDQEEAGVSDAETQQFIELVRAAGRPIGLYHSASGFGGVSADFQWVADYRSGSVSAGYPRTTPTDGSTPVEYPGWDIWQWSSTGGIGGLGLDVNWINPATPLAKLLRLGYVTEVAADAAVEALRQATDAAAAEALRKIAELENQVTALEVQAQQQSAILASMNVELTTAKADLLTTKQALTDAEDARDAALVAAENAAIAERERLAEVEKQRILNS